MTNKHAKRILQPSQLKRTLNCPGWGNASAAIAEPPDNEYAAKGSVAHHLGEICLTHGHEAVTFVGKSGWYHKGDTGIGSPSLIATGVKDFTFLIDEDMADAVQIYIDECRRIKEVMVNATFTIEQKLSLAWLVPGMFGTGDYTAVELLGRLHVADYKNGFGLVEVERNPQLMAYGLMALGDGNPNLVETVTTTIVQPNAPHSDGPVRAVTYKVKDLVAWGNDALVPGIKAAQQPDAPLKQGSWCDYCPARAKPCPEVTGNMFDIGGVKHDGDLVPVETGSLLPDPNRMDAAKLDRWLEFIPTFVGLCTAVEAEAHHRLETGAEDAPDQWKLVSGKMSNRAWKVTDGDVYGAVKTLLARKEVMVEKALSPAKLEKALKKAGKDFDMNPYLKDRTPGKPIMVPVGDKRPKLVQAEEMFGGAS